MVGVGELIMCGLTSWRGVERVKLLRENFEILYWILKNKKGKLTS